MMATPNQKIPKNGNFIAEVFHVFRSQILLQKHFDGNISSIPNSTEYLSKKP